jgi:regulator of sigma E protease
MTNALISIISVTFVLGILILVHEWGHFVAAKLLGVRVNIFSLGLGPRIWGRQRGHTDYRLSALPFGGYVKMAGDNPSEERSGDPDEFLSKPRWQRVLIAIAGPTMNILLTVVLFAGLFMSVGVPVPAYYDQPAVVAALPANADAGGIHADDRIAEFNGIKNPTWEQVYTELSRAQAGAKISVTVERGSARLAVSVTAKAGESDKVLGYPAMPPLIDEVAPGMPADRAGLKADDQILSLNGKPIVTWPQFTEGIRGSNGEAIHLVVRRAGQEVPLEIRPKQGPNPQGEIVWQIGAAVKDEESYKRLPVLTSLKQAVFSTGEASKEVVGVVVELLTGKVSVKQLQSVVGIARLSGRAAQRGPTQLIYLTALISVNLGILNLLPIPILDGGHVLLLAIEGALRRDLSVAVKERFVQVGLVFLLVVFAIVMYNDIARMLPVH